MPTDLPSRGGPTLDGLEAHAHLLSDALASYDAFLVSRVLRDIAAAQGQNYAMGDDPALSVVLATIQALALELMARPVEV